jgi:aminoglycoside phosphotransferase (APT) family kinase protein
MHDDELEIDEGLVRRLLEEQFPGWATLPLGRVALMGTDNALYRLGDRMVVRLPRIVRAAMSLEKERRWLPRIGPELPLAVPEVLGEGVPSEPFPLSWAVYSWLPGERVAMDGIGDEGAFAADLAAFLTALHAVDTTGGPLPGEHNFGRGEPLAVRDAEVEVWLGKLQARRIDAGVIATVWDAALHAPPWEHPPVWIHGDLDATNLLMTGGSLAGVIDFGGLGVGDPACDIMIAWKMLTPRGRETFRSALAVDDATWLRSRGWIASQAAGALSYYTDDNHPVLVGAARRWIAELSSSP